MLARQLAEALEVLGRQFRRELPGGLPAAATRKCEDLLIETALRLAKGNQGIAASMLGLKRQTLNMRLKVRRESGETP